jgi:hypothetical protein
MTGEGGPMIMDNQLRPVWFHGVGRKVAAADLKQETLMGQPVLLWWQGVVNSTGATTKGKLVVVNEQYRTIGTLKARAPWVISLHDASFVPGTPNIWVTAYRKVKNQSLGHGRKGTVYDVGLQEYNLNTKKLIKTWDALNPGHKAHVPLSLSEQPPPSKKDVRHGAIWDAYHLNSVQVLPNGQLLVSMRNTWGVYLINSKNGKLIWTLGGKHSFFNFAKNAHFAWQHHAEMLPNGDVSLFNDNCTVNSRGLDCLGGHDSTGMVLRLNVGKRKATLAKAFHHSGPLHTAFLGSMQLIGNGGAVIGWGSLPYFSEYSKSGKQLLNVKWPGKDQTYRALYTGNWVGTPYYPPSGAARKSKGKVKVYASWNGATEVAKWQVFAGNSASQLTKVATKRRTGFETVITLSKAHKAYEVRALDAHGNLLRSSKTFS